MNCDRSSGVLLPVTALPGPHGIGDLGAGARRFLDFLADADQSHWQVLPLGPTRAVADDSPYQSPSTFAGNPLLVSLDRLVDRGWLRQGELPVPFGDPETVDYDRAREHKLPALRRAAERFDDRANARDRAAFDRFRERERAWLDDYARYRAISHERGGDPWTAWPAPLRDREPEALDDVDERLADEIRLVAFRQFCFDEQWRALRADAADRGVDLLGDLPIYVALDSADVWANRDRFQVTGSGPTAVAGVPPNHGDAGQRWGNPLYDWERMAERDFRWWRRRVDRLLDLVDRARLDHFKGFDAYWAIPADADDPAAGEWRPAPGGSLFERLREDLGALPFVAENLGFLDPGAEGLRERFGVPGMRVPHYADWCSEGHMYQPMHYPEDCVAYTATHDTDTTVGYHRALDDRQRDCLHYNLGVDGSDIAWSMCAAVWGSAARLALTTVQDLHGLDGDARMNVPGTASGNWRWRCRPDLLDDATADRLAELTARHDR